VFFAIIERQALRRGDFASVQELMTAIRRFCDSWNQRCRPLTWTKDADQILTNLNSVLHKGLMVSLRGGQVATVWDPSVADWPRSREGTLVLAGEGTARKWPPWRGTTSRQRRTPLDGWTSASG